MKALRGDKLLAALGSAAIVGGGLAALALGLGVNLPSLPARDALTAIFTLPDRAPPPPPPPQLPPPPPPPRELAAAPTGAPAPEGLKAEASPVVAPAPRIVLPVNPPIVAAPRPGEGSQNAQGAGLAGSGSGAGGRGDGSGGGRGGDGQGANAGVARLPRQVAGRIRFSDLPADLRKAREGADITVRYRIGVDGRVSGCTVVSSSGRPDVDAGTCQRITERFRFRPARDARGDPVPFLMTETHGWDDVEEGP